jgi:hypothetical protein
MIMTVAKILKVWKHRQGAARSTPSDDRVAVGQNTLQAPRCFQTLLTVFQFAVWTGKGVVDPVSCFPA